MFSKAKIKRFNEEVGCAPPPTHYNVSAGEAAGSVTFEKCNRFKDDVLITPSPFTRPNSFRRKKLGEERKSPSSSLKDQKLNNPRSKTSLNKKFSNLKLVETDSFRELCQDATTQYDSEEFSHLFSAKETQTEGDESQVTMDSDRFQLLQEELSHLITLRDNLESTVSKKDDQIADLYTHLDMVIEDEQKHKHIISMKQNEILRLIDQTDKYKKQISNVQEDFENVYSMTKDLHEFAYGQFSQLSCIKDSLHNDSSNGAPCDETSNSEKESSVKPMFSRLNTAKIKEKFEDIKKLLIEVYDNANEINERAQDLLLEIEQRENSNKKRFSDAVSEQETFMCWALDEMNKDRMMLQTAELELEIVKSELSNESEQNKQLSNSIRELTLKVTHLEDALACEEAESREILMQMQDNLNIAEDKARIVGEKLAALQTTNDGFASQISQLRLDMQKKCIAVEEMQRCIDMLREEKSDLQIVYDELLHTFETNKSSLQRVIESKDEAINELKLEIASKEERLKELSEFNNILANQNKSLSESKQSIELTLQSDINSLNITYQNEVKIRHEAEAKISELESVIQILEEKITQSSSEEAVLEDDSGEEASTTTNQNTEEYRNESIENLAQEATNNSEEVNEMRSLLNESEKEVEFWKNKFESLQELVEPYKEQLAAYHSERELLLSESSIAQKEMQSLSEQYGKLLGHANHKQKIHHIVKLKEENCQLKKDLLKIRHELDTLRLSQSSLEERTSKKRKAKKNIPIEEEDKENCRSPRKSVINVTPLKSSNKYNRL